MTVIETAEAGFSFDKDFKVMGNVSTDDVGSVLAPPDIPWLKSGPLTISHAINVKVLEELHKHAQYSPSRKSRWTIYSAMPGNTMMMSFQLDEVPVSNPVRLSIKGVRDGQDQNEWIGVHEQGHVVVIPDA